LPRQSPIPSCIHMWTKCNLSRFNLNPTIDWLIWVEVSLQWQTTAEWPDWANFRLLSDCLLIKRCKIVQISGFYGKSYVKC
jgi:hypothetical protein